MSASDTEVHGPAEKVMKPFCKNWFPEYWKLPSFPYLPLLCFHPFSLTKCQQASGTNYQAGRGPSCPLCPSKLVC